MLIIGFKFIKYAFKTKARVTLKWNEHTYNNVSRDLVYIIMSTMANTLKKNKYDK